MTTYDPHPHPHHPAGQSRDFNPAPRLDPVPMQPSLFTEGIKLPPSREAVLVALDYLDAVPAVPQAGATADEIRAMIGIGTNVIRFRLTELRDRGFIRSGECPNFFGRVIKGDQTRHAHYLSDEGHRRARWAVRSRPGWSGWGGKPALPERRLLERLYLENGTPADRLGPQELSQIGDVYRHKTRHEVTNATLYRFILTARKQGQWPKLGRRRTEEEPGLDGVQRNRLWRPYRRGETTDTLITNREATGKLADQFEAFAGETLPADRLVRALVSGRKAGTLPRLCR